MLLKQIKYAFRGFKAGPEPDLIQKKKHEVLDLFFIIGAVIGSTAIFLSIVLTERYVQSNDMWFDIAGMLLMISVYRFRNMISLTWKATIFLVIIYLLFMIDLLFFGLNSTQNALIVIIPFLSVIVFDTKKTILIYIFTLLSYCIVGFLVIKGFWSPTVIMDNNYDTTLWINNGIIFTVVALVITIFLSRYNSSLIFALKRQQEQTKRLKISDEELNQHLSEKNVMIQEIHHRVKNNLAIVSGLLELQVRSIDDSSVRTVMQKSINRIMSIAKVHKLLYQSSELDRIPLKNYLHELTDTILDTMSNENDQVTLNMEGDEAYVTVNHGVPVGIIFNELVTNSLKYAQKEDQPDGIAIGVQIETLENDIHIRYSDNGPGFEQNSDQATGLGMTLVHSLMDQLDAKCEIHSKGEFRIAFKFSMDG